MYRKKLITIKINNKRYIVLFCSYNGLQKVGNTAENCKWYNFSPNLGVTPRILFTQNRISIENSK